MKIDPQIEKVEKLTVPKKKYKLLKLINSLSLIADYRQYFDRSGIEVTGENWPV